MRYELNLPDYEKLTLRGRFIFLDFLEKFPEVSYSFPEGPHKRIVVTLGNNTNLISKIHDKLTTCLRFS